MVQDLTKILVKALALGLYASCQSQKLDMYGHQANANNPAAADANELANVRMHDPAATDANELAAARATAEAKEWHAYIGTKSTEYDTLRTRWDALSAERNHLHNEVRALADEKAELVAQQAKLCAEAEAANHDNELAMCRLHTAKDPAAADLARAEAAKALLEARREALDKFEVTANRVIAAQREPLARAEAEAADANARFVSVDNELNALTKDLSAAEVKSHAADEKARKANVEVDLRVAAQTFHQGENN